MEQSSVGMAQKPSALHDPSYLKYQTKATELPSTSSQNSTTESRNQFPQPSSKLEQIEKFLLDTKSCELCATAPLTNHPGSSGISASSKTTKPKANGLANLHSSSGIINISNPNSVLTGHSCCNKILTNLVLFDEPKIFSLQRSISEKLRNSLKSTTNNINLLNSSTSQQQQASSSAVAGKQDASTGQLKIPRKWHSERCRISSTAVNNATKPPSSRFSTQVPLNNHYKAILAQYTSKAKMEQQISEPASNSNKINTKISKLNKKLSYVTKKRASQSEAMNQNQVN